MVVRGLGLTSHGGVRRSSRATSLAAAGRLIASPRGRVAMLAIALAAAAAALQSSLAFVPAPQDSPFTIPWWAIAIAFAAAEIGTIYVYFGRHAHSWSMTEVPLVVGLAFTPAAELVAGAVLGYAVALIVHHRQSVMKWSFNLAVAWLETVVAVLVYRGLLAGGAPNGGAGWAAAYAAVAVATWGVSGLAVPAAIWVHDRQWRAPVLRWMAIASAVSGVTNTSIGLLAVAVLWSQPTAIWLVVVVALVTLVAYRTYGAWRQRHDTLLHLHQLTQLDGARLPGDVAQELLEHARELLRAEAAELVLLSPQGTIQWHEACGRQDWTPLEPADVADLPGVTDQLVSHRRIGRSALPPLFGRNAVREAVLVVLRRAGQPCGVLLVADRLDDVSTFGREDLRTLQTVGHHAVVTLENCRLLDLLREEAEDRRHESRHDGLTGLPNRAAFHELLHTAIETESAASPFAVLLLDLDRFKEVNDTLGHQIGDLLLRQVAARLRGALPPPCHVARLGGDEFVILVPAGVMPAEDGLAAVFQLARECRDALTAGFRLGELDLEVEASIGVALYPDHGGDSSRLLQSADIAMYSAKRSGSQVEVYNSAVDAHTPRRLTLLGGLRAALDLGEVEVHYQPKAAIATGRVTAVEALVRWRHPDYGFIAPAEFLPLAEHSGLIHRLGDHVIRAALQQARAWRHNGLDIEVAVNLSARNLLDVTLPERVAGMLEELELPPGTLRCELTETSMMSDPRRTIATLERLRGLGVGVSVDDFGTGHSSLSYLKGLPADEIKVDRSFVRDMSHDDGDAMIVRSTIDLARNLGLSVVAEGVENQITWDLLAGLDCDIAQGYLLLRAVPADELERWLMAYRPRVGAAVT